VPLRRDTRPGSQANHERLELAVGIEPTTRSLQVSRSTVELRQPAEDMLAAIQTG
jgi:hypothetical protein